MDIKNANVRFSRYPEPDSVQVIAYLKACSAVIVHLISFIGIKNMKWKAIQPKSKEQKDITLLISNKTPSLNFTDAYLIKVDERHKPMKLDFITKGDSIVINIPSLKYWDIVIIRSRN